MIEPKQNIKTCPNCQQTYDNSFNYCPQCGQPNKQLKLNFKYFISEFLSGMFNLDSKIFRTLKLLFFKPGKLSKEFIAGKRNSYIQPVRLYLVGSLIYFTFSSLVSVPIKFDDNTLSKSDSTSNIVTLDNLDSLQTIIQQSDIGLKDEGSGDSFLKESFFKEKLKKISTKQGQKEFKEKLVSYIPIGMFILVPLTALLLFLFFKKDSYYIEHLIFVIHLQTLFYILFTIFNLVELIVPRDIVDGINGVLFLFITLIWIKRYYDVSWWTTIWKTTLFLVSYGFIFLLFILSLSSISFFLL